MNYTEEDLDSALDKLMIERGEHPTRVRNPLYGKERDLAKRLVKLFAIPVVMKSLPTESECENFVDKESLMFGIPDDDEIIKENGYYLTVTRLYKFIKYCQGNVL